MNASGAAIVPRESWQSQARSALMDETMKAVFAGSFAVRLADPVKERLKVPCEIVPGHEAAILQQLSDADVLVSMGFDGAMAAAAPRLRLVQVPGAGLDRIDRSNLRPGLALANAYGHEAGIAEYIMGAMIALTRSFRCIDQKPGPGSGRASGRSECQRRRCGRNLLARQSAFLVLATSGKRWRDGRMPST